MLKCSTMISIFCSLTVDIFDHLFLHSNTKQILSVDKLIFIQMNADSVSSLDRIVTILEGANQKRKKTCRKRIFIGRRLCHQIEIYSHILHQLQTSIQWKATNRDLDRLPRIRLRRRLRPARMAPVHRDRAPSRLVRYHRPAVTPRPHLTAMR